MSRTNDDSLSSIVSLHRKNKNQASLRLAWVNRDLPDVPRKYAQSTSGRRPSQRTTPPDSRSIAMASDSPAGRSPYATFRKCPSDVLQPSAKDSRSDGCNFCRYSFKPMTDYHHTVTGNATPSGEFTKWCRPVDNDEMGKNAKAEVRRENLRRFVELRLGSNRSELARLCNPNNPNPSYFNDLLKPGSKKSFGEKAAEKIEQCVRLKPGQLSLENSPLEMIEPLRSAIETELEQHLSAMSPAEKARLLETLKKPDQPRKRTG